MTSWHMKSSLDSYHCKNTHMNYIVNATTIMAQL